MIKRKVKRLFKTTNGKQTGQSLTTTKSKASSVVIAKILLFILYSLHIYIAYLLSLLSFVFFIKAGHQGQRNRLGGSHCGKAVWYRRCGSRWYGRIPVRSGNASWSRRAFLSSVLPVVQHTDSRFALSHSLSLSSSSSSSYSFV